MPTEQDDFIRRALELFPGSRLLSGTYCEQCCERPGRYSDLLKASLCDNCWRAAFYAQRLPENRKDGHER